MINLIDSVVVSVFDLDLITRKYTNSLLGASDFVNKFSLESEKLYDVALDQSNTCTGMTIRTVKEDRLIITEVINNGIDLHVYRNILVNILGRILPGKRVRYFLIEEPLGYITGQRNRELSKLKDVLTKFVSKTKGLDIKKFDTTPPQTWRSGLIKKDNPHPKNSKLACVFEVKRLYPETEAVQSHAKEAGTDYDGYESCGILCGYINKHAITNDSDVVKIIGPINTAKQGFGIFINSNDQKTLSDVIKLINMCYPKLGDPNLKYYNEDNTLYENVKMSLVDDFTITTIVSSLANLSVRHLFQLGYGEGLFYLIVIPATGLKEKFIKALVLLDAHCELFY